MPDYITVLSDVEDRALHAGRVVSLRTHGAPFVHVTLAGKRVKLGDAETNGGSAPPRRPTLGTQRGDCPYCEKTDILLSPHIKTYHPGKLVPWLGPNPLKCSRCSATFPTKASLGTHVRNMHKRAKKPAKKQTKKSGGNPE